MNIKEAKQQIKNTIIAYSSKDEYGKTLIPISKQRPVFVLGAPGIGKTAIMEQIAQELDMAFVSYSMTHHTRQSALGLPYIVDKQYDDVSYKVSEYTMSEIIASIYDTMEATNKKNGILFLDEINCISETLAPSMLQFLQYKTFGRHQVPDGWIVVTAGNPPEYNNSVKEYDIAMWDRLKKIEVTADFEVWKEYALNQHIHPVVTTYLSIKSNHFYSISTTVDGKSFVTARSWVDLSMMIQLYEINDIPVDRNLIEQYLQDEKIAKDFTHYYQLFHKYQSDYQVDTILDGTSSDDIKKRAKNSTFDESLSLISLIMSQLDETIAKTVSLETTIKDVMTIIKGMKDNCHSKDDYIQAITNNINDIKLMLQQKEAQNNLSNKENQNKHLVMNLLTCLIDSLNTSNDEPTSTIKARLNDEITIFKQLSLATSSALDNVFAFFEDVFGDGQEMLVLVTEMTINQTISKYIFTHGCDKYYQHNKQLLFEDKNNELLDRIDSINLLSFENE